MPINSFFKDISNTPDLPNFFNLSFNSIIDLPKNVKVGAILRDSKVIIPNSETVFKIDDDVVFYSDTSSIKKLEELLAFQK